MADKDASQLTGWARLDWSKFDRKVTCPACKQPMFYQGDPRAVPEITVEISLPRWQEAVTVSGFTKLMGHVSGMQKHYVHVECWNKLWPKD